MYWLKAGPDDPPIVSAGLPKSGAVVSILTLTALLGDSTFPALSVAKNVIVWMPSLEWFAAASIVTSPPAPLIVCTEPPSTSYLMFSTPAPPAPSLAERLTVTSLACQPASFPLAELVGGVVSTRIEALACDG